MGQSEANLSKGSENPTLSAIVFNGLRLVVRVYFDRKVKSLAARS
jgi:hypothetical protein